MSSDEKLSEVSAFAKEIRATFPVVHDVKAKISEKYGVLGLSANLLVDRRGKIVYSMDGADLPGLEKAVAGVMGGK